MYRDEWVPGCVRSVGLGPLLHPTLITDVILRLQWRKADGPSSIWQRGTKRSGHKRTTDMDAKHASLGRRTLEEIRQKRAAERLTKVSSGPDLTNASSPIDSVGIRKSESGNRISDVRSMYPFRPIHLRNPFPSVIFDSGLKSW
ncbi:hypothetical protein RJ641_032830 [Dillenia turbinata]|uniref:Uncharacterized protein n=1 Tax=Dillenia turbinata TaxID=194707 RepID=A0AAN8VKE4_9MAGN